MSWIMQFFLLACCLFHSGIYGNSVIKCPKPIFKEGSSNLTLTINSSTFGGCDIGPTSATCTWRPENGTDKVICIQSVTRCDMDLTNEGCRCTGVEGQIYTYDLAFSMLPGQEKGSITCELDCIVVPPNSGPKATVVSDTTCQNVKFDSKCDKDWDPCINGVCIINENDNQECDCSGTLYDGDICEDHSWRVIILIVVLTSVLLGATALLAFVCGKKKTEVIYVKTERQLQTKVGKKEFADQLQGKTSSSLGVIMLRSSTEDLTAIVLESRNAVHLRAAQKQIFSEFSSLKTPSTICSTQGQTPSERSSCNNTTRGSTPPRKPKSQPEYTGKGNGVQP